MERAFSSRRPAATRGTRRSARGFTLMELLVVIAIIGTVVALAPPLWSNAVPATEQRAAARRVAQLMRVARMDAVAQRHDVPVNFDLQQRMVAVAGHKPFRIPDGIEIALTTTEAEKQDDSKAAVRFYPDGGSTGGRVTLTVGERAYRIDIDWLSGRIAIDDA